MSKKIFVSLLVLTILVSLPLTVFGASKQDVMNLFDSASSINGRDAAMPANIRAALRDFLNGDEFTEAEVDSMYSYMSEAIAIVRDSGQTSYQALDADTQAVLQSLASNAASSVGATLSYDGGSVSVIDRTGRSISVNATLGGSYGYVSSDPGGMGTTGGGSGSGVTPRDGFDSQNNPIKMTGTSVNLLPLYTLSVALVSVLVATTIFMKRKNLITRGC